MNKAIMTSFPCLQNENISATSNKVGKPEHTVSSSYGTRVEECLKNDGGEIKII